MARDFLHDDRAARPTILALVIGAHLSVLFIPSVDHKEASRDWGPSSSLLLIPLLLPEERLLREPSVKLPPTAVTSPRQPSLAPLQLSSEGLTSELATSELPDWRASGAAAAADAASKEYRALGPVPAAPKIKMPPSPFKEKPRHEAGELDVDAARNPILWLNGFCYLRPENREAAVDDPFAKVPMTFCNFAIGKRAPRGDLFDHLRKKPPVP